MSIGGNKKNHLSIQNLHVHLYTCINYVFLDNHSAIILLIFFLCLEQFY